VNLLFSIKTIKTSKGGSERVMSQITSCLVKKHDITVLTFDDKNGETAYPFNSAVKKIFLGVGDAGKKATLIESIRRITALRKFIRSENPDMVIAFQHSMFIPMSIALIGIKIPLISSEHIVPKYYSDKRKEYALLLFAGLLSDRITVISEKIKNMYPLILRSRMVAISNPVSILKPGLLHNHDSSNGGIILNIGRLEPQKDQKTLIKAFALVANNHPNWKLRIIGDGTLKNELEILANETGFAKRISFSGTVDDISKEYHRAHIFVMSSRYESFGLCTAEAIVHGIPVIGFADCPGTNELIVNEENGLLVEGPVRHEALAFAIEKLIVSPKLRQSMGKGGKAILDRFSLDKVVDEWDQLIHEVAIQ